MRVNHNLRLWYQDTCDRERASDEHEPCDLTDAKHEPSLSHARAEQCRSRKTTTGGSTPPVTSTTGTPKRVRWADEEGGELCMQRTYEKTKWSKKEGVQTRGRGRRRGRGGRGGRGHPMRRDRNAKIWKTVT